MRLLVVCSLLITGLLSAQPKSFYGQPKPLPAPVKPIAYVYGTVVDPSRALMTNISVKVSSDTTSCATKTNERGEFNCAVPPGRYNVSVTEEQIGYQRASMNLPAGSLTRVTLQIMFTAGGVAFTVDESGSHDVLSPPLYKVQNQIVTLDGVEAMVRYVSKVDQLEQTTFTGPDLMLTAEALTIYGDRITCTNPVKSCTVSGKVIVELGEQRLDGTKLVLDLATRKFTLTREPEVTNTF